MHLTDFHGPFFCGDAAVMNLAHDGTYTLSVDYQAMVIPCHWTTEGGISGKATVCEEREKGKEEEEYFHVGWSLGTSFC